MSLCFSMPKHLYFLIFLNNLILQFGGEGWKIEILEKFNINSVFFFPPECLWFLFGCVERVTVVLSLMSLIFTRKMIDAFLEVVIKPFKYQEP